MLLARPLCKQTPGESHELFDGTERRRPIRAIQRVIVLIHLSFTARKKAASSVASQMGIVASLVSVAVVSLRAYLLSAQHKLAGFDGYVDLLLMTIPSSMLGVLVIGIFSWLCGKDLDKGQDFQKFIAAPEKNNTCTATTLPCSANSCRAPTRSRCGFSWARLWSSPPWAFLKNCGRAGKAKTDSATQKTRPEHPGLFF